ncbi:MAG: DUF433 domain-containing protein [Armatimonadetes bacterium]|nr:DUF433 domain-containing protein [Armatimonadota bacterium]
MTATNSRIIIDPDIMVGKPVITGTRLTVEFIVGLLGNGWSYEEVLHNYSHITLEDIRACLTYAAEVVAEARPAQIPPRKEGL